MVAVACGLAVTFGIDGLNGRVPTWRGVVARTGCVRCVALDFLAEPGPARARCGSSASVARTESGPVPSKFGINRQIAEPHDIMPFRLLAVDRNGLRQANPEQGG
jgi:hypothetical protein